MSLSLCAAALSGCGGGTVDVNSPTVNATQGQSASAPRTNVEELGVLIRVPYETEDIAWKDYPAEKKIIAVLRLSPLDADRLVAAAQPFGPPQLVTVSIEPWFPDELIAQGDTSGDSNVRGQAYPA
ncbi:MAG: hypothetical protein ABR530_10275, partial [Pyrinomonadaceae bacterium]